jgi:SagB-type dehydrogenase family enzyme
MLKEPFGTGNAWFEPKERCRFMQVMVVRTLLALVTVFAIVIMLAVPMAKSSEAFEKIEGQDVAGKDETILLPKPDRGGSFSLTAALSGRRSCRKYTGKPLSLADAGQLLWASQGITDFKRGYRTAPSAGATYPLEMYLVARRVEELLPGVFRYQPEVHALQPVKEGDLGKALQDAAFGQGPVGRGAAVFVIAAVFTRTTKVYGERGIKYVHLEAGHAAQNLCLMATALGLGSVVVGAFDDDAVLDVTEIPETEDVLYLIPVGECDHQ